MAERVPNTNIQIILAIAVGVFIIFSIGLIHEKLNEKPFVETGAAVVEQSVETAAPSPVSKPKQPGHLLGDDEFAIITFGEENPDYSATLTLSTGQQIITHYQNVLVVEPAEGQKTFVDPNIAIHTYSELDETGQKVSPSIKRKLKKSETVNVIIEMNLPFENFYEHNQIPERVREKQVKFDQARERVTALLNSKQKIKDLKIINSVAAEVDEESLARLENSPQIKRVTPDNELHIVLDTSLDEINAKNVWVFTDSNGVPITGTGKVIAIIDTGIDYKHPDLGGCLGPSCKVIGGYDFVNKDADPMDDHGHGTHVAATAAGKGLLNGVAPDAQILAYKVCNSGGSCMSSDLIAAIERATDPNNDGSTSDHADVMSMSIGGGGNPDDPSSLAVDKASAVGVVSTIAAGNAGPSSSTIRSPGTARTAITVAAACKASQVGVLSSCSTPIASFSSRGPVIWNGTDIKKPDIAAPGVNICAARWDSAFSASCFDINHVRISGTSMATPHAAGAAALVRQAYPSYSPAQIKELLKNSARDLGVTYNDQGAGEINLLAAIPSSQKIISSPNIWNAETDPNIKTTYLEQTFTITSKDLSLGTVTATINLNIEGLTSSLTKTTLELGNGASDSTKLTVSVDNDLTKPGYYSGSIVLSQNGNSIGAIPIFLNILPTILVSSNTLDFGIDNPSLSTWTSDVKYVELTNLRTDTSQTFPINYTPFPAGITLNVPSSITVSAGGKSSIAIQISVDNTLVKNNVYSTMINIGGNQVRVAFNKYHELRIQNSDAKGLDAWVMTSGANYLVPLTDTSTSVLINEPGSYDVLIRYIFYESNLVYFAYDIKEDIQTINGYAEIETQLTNANNNVTLVGTLPTGETKTLFPLHLARIVYNPKDSVMLMMTMNTGAKVTSKYYVSGSSKWTFSNIYQYPWQPAKDVYFFFDTHTALQSSKTFTNLPSDFTTVQSRLSAQGKDHGRPLVRLTGAAWMNINISMPITQTIYSLAPAGYDISEQFNYDRIDCPISGACPTETFSSLFDAVTKNQWSWCNFIRAGKDNIPPISSNTIFPTLGPAVWNGKFLNSNTSIRLYDYIDDAGYLYSTSNSKAAFVLQSHALFEYDATPYILTGPNSSSGSLPIYYKLFSASRTALPTISAVAGSYEFQIPAFTYYIRGSQYTSSVIARFNTKLSDPNPPAIRSLKFLSNGNPSDVYDPSAENSIIADLDAVDPIFAFPQTVKISYSADGSSFTELSVTGTGPFKAILPKLQSISKVTIRIEATDAAGNYLSYTYEVPQGTLDYVVPDTGTKTLWVHPEGSGSVSGPDIMCPSDCAGTYPIGSSVTLQAIPKNVAHFLGWVGECTGTSTCTLVLNEDKIINAIFDTMDDKTVPNVTWISPRPDSTVSGLVVINATVKDNTGVANVTFYVNKTKYNTLYAPPFTVLWDTTKNVNGRYRIAADAIDIYGNAVTAMMWVTVKNNVTEDTQPPTAPTNLEATAVAYNQINIAWTASTDNVGVVGYDIYRNGTLIATTASTSYSNTGLMQLTKYSYYVRAKDAAGLVSSASNTASATTPAMSDTIAPSVSITSPSNGATVSGTVTLTASASDNVGVTKVEFYVDDVLKGTDSIAPYSFSWDTTTVTGGNHVLSAIAYDAATNAGVSPDVSVIVSNTDTTAPSVGITYPTDGSTVSGTINVNAIASDNVGVTKVEFYLDDVLKLTDTSSPYTYSWDTTKSSDGNHTLSALAYDAAGNVGISADVNVVVSNGPIPSNPYGNITGTVTSSTGGILSGVTVSTTVSGRKQSTKTDSKGFYNFINLPPGTYILKYQAKGFIAQSATVSVTAGKTTVQNIVLQKR